MHRRRRDSPASPPASAPPATADSDRVLEIYKAVRSHELTLNEARADLERGVLGPLVTLNGGAVVAFLTLLGALSGKESGLRPNYWVAGGAIVVWGFGLVFAALAVAAASREQGKINEGYRLMREIVEARLDKDIAAIVARDKKTEDERRCLRTKAREAADDASDARKRWWMASACAFAVGAALALTSILVNVGGESKTTTTATTTATTSIPGKPATTTVMTVTTTTSRITTGRTR